MYYEANRASSRVPCRKDRQYGAVLAAQHAATFVGRLRPYVGDHLFTLLRRNLKHGLPALNFLMLVDELQYSHEVYRLVGVHGTMLFPVRP